VYVVQWIAVLLIPILTVSMTRGWAVLLLWPLELIAFLALGALALVSVLSKKMRAISAAPLVYSILAVILWIVAAFFPLTIMDSEDVTSLPSVLGTWGVSDGADSALALTSVLACIGLWIGMLVSLVSNKPAPVAATPVLEA
jgi:hypothetical protein